MDNAIKVLQHLNEGKTVHIVGVQWPLKLVGGQPCYVKPQVGSTVICSVPLNIFIELCVEGISSVED